MSAELRLGYKQTEAGVIPMDWEYQPLDHLTDPMRPIGYGIVQTGRPVQNGVKCIRVVDIVDGQIDGDRLITTSEEISQSYKRTLLREGDLVIALRGKIGAVAVIDVTLAGSNLTRGVAILSATEAFDSHYLSQYLSSSSGKNTIERNLNGSALQEIPIATLRKIHAVVPPVAEQRAIAAALSDVDALLAKLDRLIAKKRDLKQGAMQQLLTGQTRLPRFSGEWEVKRLGKLGRFLKGSGVRKDESVSGDLRCIRYGEIYTRHNDYIKVFYSWISPEVAATATMLKEGDLLFAGSGETKEEIGKCVAFVDHTEAYAGGDIVILRPDNANAMFLGYYLNTTPINSQKASRGQGDAVVHISATALSSIDVAMPKIEEQTAIAAVLSDMDAAIAALEARRVKTRALKQGMMQELLTGRIRLI